MWVRGWEQQGLILCSEEFKVQKSKDDEHTKKLERQASAERQKVYEDVFLEEMQHYIQYGATESKPNECALSGYQCSSMTYLLTINIR